MFDFWNHYLNHYWESIDLFWHILFETKLNLWTAKICERHVSELSSKKILNDLQIFLKQWCKFLFKFTPSTTITIMSTKSYAQKSRSRTFVLVAAEKSAHCVTACTRKKFKFSRIAHINELKYFNCLQTGLRHAVVAMLC